MTIVSENEYKPVQEQLLDEAHFAYYKNFPNKQKSVIREKFNQLIEAKSRTRFAGIMDGRFIPTVKESQAIAQFIWEEQENILKHQKFLNND